MSLQGNILLRDIYIWKFGISAITTYIFDLAIVFLGIYFFEWWQKYKRCMCKVFHYSILLRAIDNPNYTCKKMSWLWHWLDKLCYIQSGSHIYLWKAMRNIFNIQLWIVPHDVFISKRIKVELNVYSCKTFIKKKKMECMTIDMYLLTQT